MKMIRQPLILAASLAAVLALSACGKTRRVGHAGHRPPRRQPAMATPMARRPCRQHMGAPAAASAVMLHVRWSWARRSTPATRSPPAAPALRRRTPSTRRSSTSGSGNATLAAKWTYQDGQTVHEDSKVARCLRPRPPRRS